MGLDTSVMIIFKWLLMMRIVEEGVTDHKLEMIFIICGISCVHEELDLNLTTPPLLVQP